MAISLSLHIIGIVFWVGGLALLTRVMQVFTTEVEPNQSSVPGALRAIVRRMSVGFVLSGLLLTSATGIYQLLQGGLSFYFKQGWFHGKLTLVAALYIVTALFAVQLKKVSAGTALSKKHLAMIHGISALLLVLIVFITFIGRLGL